MHFLPTSLHLSRDVWLGIGSGFVAAIALLCILVWVSRRRYVIIGSSPAADMVAYQLGRIADNLDTIAERGLALQNPIELAQPAPELHRGIPQSRETLEESAQTESPAVTPAEEKGAAAPARRMSLSVLGL